MSTPLSRNDITIEPGCRNRTPFGFICPQRLLHAGKITGNVLLLSPLHIAAQPLSFADPHPALCVGFKRKPGFTITFLHFFYISRHRIHTVGFICCRDDKAQPRNEGAPRYALSQVVVSPPSSLTVSPISALAAKLPCWDNVRIIVHN